MRVSLSWDNPGDESVTGYQILRRDKALHAKGEFLVHVDDTGSTATSYVDEDMELGVRYVYRVKARNAAGLSERSEWFNANMPPQTDTTGATISSVAITSDTGDDAVYLDDDGVYGIGDEIEITVSFNESVTVTGSPQLGLTIGSDARSAAYKSATGSKVVFSYTVSAGDSDADGISIEADKLSLNSGSIKDGDNNDADLSHSALSAQSGHKVDGVRPTITGVYFISSTSTQDDVHTSGEWLFADVSFSESVFVGGEPGPQLNLNLEGTTKHADLSWIDRRHDIYVLFNYRVVEGDLDLDGVAINANSVVLNGGSIRDGAGNDAVLTHGAVSENSNFIVDAVPATVKSVAITSDPGSDNTYGVGDTIESHRDIQRIRSGSTLDWFRWGSSHASPGAECRWRSQNCEDPRAQHHNGHNISLLLHGTGWRQRRGRNLHRRQQANHAI